MPPELEDVVNEIEEALEKEKATRDRLLAALEGKIDAGFGNVDRSIKSLTDAVRDMTSVIAGNPKFNQKGLASKVCELEEWRTDIEKFKSRFLGVVVGTNAVTGTVGGAIGFTIAWLTK